LAQAAVKKIQTEYFSVQNGHGVARLVSEADPDGSPAMHQKMESQRQIDSLHHLGKIDFDQHHAGTILRDSYENGRVFIDSLKASGSGEPVSGGEPPWLRDEEAWNDYQCAMQQLGRDFRQVVRAVVIEDRSPEEFSRKWRCNGVALLGSGLDRLVTHYGLIGRR
jgi:hypothetical protein